MDILVPSKFISPFIGFNSPDKRCRNVVLPTPDVYYKSEYREDVDGYYQTPYFGKSVEELDNKEVRITGFMLTLSPDEDIYVLSQNPYADCFFCGYGGPESAIELRLKPGHESFLMDELVTVTGRLELNRIDISSGVYIMHEATAIKD